MDMSIRVVQDTWRIIEESAREAGITGPATNGLADSAAEQFAKAIVARLTTNDPPIIPAYAHELAAPLSVVHKCPPEGSGVMPCCGRTPFEVSRWERLAIADELVTCNGDG